MSMSTIRMTFKGKDGSLREIFEVRELVNSPANIALLMRRKFTSEAISKALSDGGTITIEVA